MQQETARDPTASQRSRQSLCPVLLKSTAEFFIADFLEYIAKRQKHLRLGFIKMRLNNRPDFDPDLGQIVPPGPQVTYGWV